MDGAPVLKKIQPAPKKPCTSPPPKSTAGSFPCTIKERKKQGWRRVFPSAKLERRANLILSNEHDLLELEETIKKYIASKKATKDSKCEDWLDEKYGLNTPELKAIRNKHFHFSASRMKLGYAPRLVLDEKTNLKSKRKRREYNA